MHTMVVDDLVMQGARPSASRILTWLCKNFILNGYLMKILITESMFIFLDKIKKIQANSKENAGRREEYHILGS